jgi:hypothetical protein
MQHIEVEIGADASTLIHEVLVAMKGGDGTINSIKKLYTYIQRYLR